VRQIAFCGIRQEKDKKHKAPSLFPEAQVERKTKQLVQQPAKTFQV
jgi:hypothetical protein